MKQKLIKMQKAKKLNDDKQTKEDDKSKGSQLGKSGLGLDADNAEDSEEIKTEVELTSEQQSSDESSESIEKKDESRRGSAQSHIEGASPGIKSGGSKYGIAGLGGPKGGSTLGGQRLLNINVGASTIETAEKFKQRDQELFKQNFGADQSDSKNQSGISDNEGRHDHKIHQQEQDIPQEQPKIDVGQNKRIKSTHQMLLGFESNNSKPKQASSNTLSRPVEQVTRQDSQQNAGSQLHKQESALKIQPSHPLANQVTQPKSILKKTTVNQPQTQAPEHHNNLTKVGSYRQLQESRNQSSKEFGSSISSSISSRNGLSKQGSLVDAKLKKKSSKELKEDSRFKIIQDAQMRDRDQNNLLNPQTTTRLTKPNTKLSAQEIAKSNAMANMSKFKSNDQHVHEIMKNFSPFNMNSELERIGNSGIQSFLPSYHEHKLSLMRGHSSKRGDLTAEKQQYLDEEEEYDKKKSYKRSGTQLLGNIKDPASNKNLAFKIKSFLILLLNTINIGKKSQKLKNYLNFNIRINLKVFIYKIF